MSGTSIAAKKMATQMASVQLAYDSGKISLTEYNAQMDALRAEMQVTSTTAKVMGTAIRTALNVGLFVAIEFGVWIIQKLVNAEKEAIEYANEMTTAYKSQKQEIENLRQEYLDIVDSTESEAKKSEELYKWKKKLIQAYGYEKSAIEGVTTARATGLKFFDKEEYDNAIEIINQNNKDDVYNKLYERMYGENSGNKNYSSGHIEVDLSDLNWLKEYGIYAESLYSESDRIGEVVYKFGDNVETSIDNINNVLAILNKKANTSAGLTGYEKIIKGHLDLALADFENAQKESEDVLNTTGEALFTTRYSDFLQKYGNELDKLTKENFDSWKDKFNKYLAETEENLLSDENFVKIRDEYFKNLKIDLFPDEVIAETNKYGYSLTSLSEKLEAFSDITKDVSTKQSTIQSALEKVRAGTSLTSDEMQKLGDVYPDLLGKFEETVDGWTISADDLIDANDKIVKSLKNVIEEQKKILNENIEKIKAQLADIPTINGKSDYDEWQAKQAQLNKDLVDGENQLRALDNILKTFNIDISEGTSKLKDYDDALKYTQTLNKMLGSLDTANSLLSNWTDTDQWKKEFSDVVDAIVEAFPNDSRIKQAAEDWFRTQTKDSAQILVNEYRWAYNTDLNNFNEYQYNKLGDDESAWEDFIKKNTEFVDEFKTAYGIDLANIATYKKAREELLKANDFDPFSAEAKAFNEGALKEFDEATAYFGKLFKPFSPETKGSSTDLVKKQFDTFMQEYEKLHDRGLMSDEDYYNKLEEANELYYKNCADHLDDYISNETKIYNARKEKYKSDTKEMVDNLKDQYNAGKIALEDYAKVLSDLSSSRYGEGSTYFGTEFAKDALKENFKDAFDTITDAAKDSLSKMLITPDKYLDLINEWGKKLEITDGVLEKAKEVLSESDYLDAWDLANGYDSKNNKDYELRAKRVAYIYELAEKLYGKNGQNNVKAYNELIKQGLEEEKSIWEDRVNDEKSFWEDRQEEIETYYDTQIDKIKDVQEEENKLKDLEEKRLALIKARQNLENAKNQRNQLIFEGGTFRYDVDQDAILSAEEELADAIEALRDEELNTQIELLEEQKNNAVEFYKNIIDKIDEYLNKEDKILNSDSDVLNTILESDAPKANFDMQKFIDGGSNFESLVRALGGTFTQKAADYFKDSYNATLVGKQITPSTIDKVVNNSNSTTNNNSKSVIIEKMEINVKLTLQSLDDFVDDKIEGFGKKIIEGMNSQLPKVLAKA